MKRFTLSVSAISLTSLGLLLASACSTDDGTSDAAGGAVGLSGGNTYMQGGNTNRGGAAPGTGGAVATGGKATSGGAATGGAINAGGSATGGAATTGGKAATGGASVAGNAGKGGTAGSPATGGANTAGKGGAAGSPATGGANTAGKGGAAGSPGTGGASTAGSAGKAAGTAGTAGAGTAGSGPACATDPATLAAGFCAPPASLANLPLTSGKFGNYFLNATAGSVHIYNVDPSIPTPVDGDFMTGSPFTVDPCAGAGVNASGKTGMSVTVTNNLAAPVDVLLYVIDQAGTAAPYTIVTMTGRTTVPANAANLTLQVPFVGASAAFTATCSYSSAIALNLATVRQVGIGFDSANNQVDVALLGMAFY